MKVLEGTFAASLLAVVVFAVQFALGRRLSAAWRFVLWLPVLLRLLLPLFPESPVQFVQLACCALFGPETTEHVCSSGQRQ